MRRRSKCTVPGMAASRVQALLPLLVRVQDASVLPEFSEKLTTSDLGRPSGEVKIERARYGHRFGHLLAVRLFVRGEEHDAGCVRED